MKKWCTKLWKVMKICAVQLMIAITVCGVSLAHDSDAQLLERKISLTVTDVPLQRALKEIETAAGVRIFYSIDQLDYPESVSIQARDKELRAVLDELFGSHHIRYKVDEKKRVIFLKRERDAFEGSFGAPNGTVTDRSIRSVAHAISGTVVDGSTQQPMAGVNVIVKGTTTGTTTDVEGKYSIQADDKSILVFSFIGYSTFEISVDGRSVIDVVMQEDVMGLGEVVVNAGYWQVTDKERTGSIAKIEAKEIAKQPVQNTLAALQGRVPGLEIIQETGVPGGNFTVRIRGTNSIANGNDPLYIIDGVPFISTTMAFNETSVGLFGNAQSTGGTSPLNSINPSDIASIEILKDADATAVYGSRGANGVILITTKKAQAGKTKVDFSLYTGAGRVASKMDLLNTQQYVTMRRETLKNINSNPTSKNAPDIVSWDTTRYNDWQKELIGGTAGITNAQLSLSGGDKYNQFLVGVGFHKEGTAFPGNGTDKRYSMHVRLTNRSQNEKLSTSVSIKYSVNDTDLIKEDLTAKALSLPPNAPLLYNELGNLNWGTDLASDNWTQDLPHPLSYLKTGYEATSKNLLTNLVVGYKVLENLEGRVNMGYSDVDMNAITTTPKSFYAPALASLTDNSSAFATSKFRNWTVEPQMNWTPKLGEGRLNILVGTSFLEELQEGLAQYAQGFSSETLMKNIAASSSRTTATNYYSQYRYHAAFGRINYSFKERYIINLTGRRDGSSRFGPGRQFANFGAVGMAWIFSNEPFVQKNFSVLSFGKIRGSYGISGNDQLGNYQYLDAYTSSGSYLGVVGLAPVRLANPDFAWEKNKKLEIALDLGFVNNRILSSVSLYRNRSTNQLVGYALPPTTGFNSIQGNLPAVVDNTGVELEISTRNIDKGAFTWATSFNLSVPRNRLVEFPNLEGSPTYANTLVIGEPTTILKRYHYIGVDPQTGLYQFEDVNGDGLINTADRQSIKFVGQEFYGGLLNTFSVKGFQIDILFQFVKQSRTNYLSAFASNPGNGRSNQPVWVMGRWRNPGEVADIQMFTTSPGNTPYSRLRSSDRSISDASFIRLKNISISYSLHSSAVAAIHVSSAQIFIQGQNLLTMTNYLGLDPETTSATALPPLKILSGGIRLSL